MKAKNEYKLPAKQEDIVKVDRTTSPAHKGKLKHAVDFLFTDKIGDFSVEGKQILAAADGEVVWLRDDSNEGGPDEKYWYKGNCIMIKHANEEFTFYDHFRHKGIIPKVGNRVKEGDIIGHSGNTGYTFLSHLHFEVRKFTGPEREDYETLEVKFKELGE